MRNGVGVVGHVALTAIAVTERAVLGVGVGAALDARVGLLGAAAPEEADEDRGADHGRHEVPKLVRPQPRFVMRNGSNAQHT